MKLWITGANGFLGKALQKMCTKEGIPFVITLKEEVDISFIDQVNRFAERVEFSHIVNCAALAHVDLAEKNPDAAFRVNVLGPENLGKLALDRKIPIVHFSTEYIFNGCQSNAPFKEIDIPHPIGVYGITKREGEVRLLNADPKACIIRTSWLFGGDGKTFLSSILERLKRDKILHVADDQKGRATYIEDLVRAIFSLLNHHGIFHFANQGEASRYEIALEIRDCALECGIPIVCNDIVPMTSNFFSQINKRPSRCVMDTTKFEKLFQKPIRLWKEAVKDLVQSNATIEGEKLCL